MSTPRVGPHNPPVGATETGPETTTPVAAGKSAQPPHAPADRVVAEAPKAGKPKGQQTTSSAFERPTAQPIAERRARFGGERGAWLASTRRGILFAANNPEVGQELLESFTRGFG